MQNEREREEIDYDDIGTGFVRPKDCHGEENAMIFRQLDKGAKVSNPFGDHNYEYSVVVLRPDHLRGEKTFSARKGYARAVNDLVRTNGGWSNLPNLTLKYWRTGEGYNTKHNVIVVENEGRPVKKTDDPMPF